MYPDAVDIMLEALVVGGVSLLPFTAFVFTAWKCLMAPWAWGLIEEGEMSKQIGLLRKDYWYPLWRLVAQKRSRVLLGLSDCEASVDRINEKARTDYDRLMSCTESYIALLARTEDLVETYGRTWGHL